MNTSLAFFFFDHCLFTIVYGRDTTYLDILWALLQYAICDIHADGSQFDSAPGLSLGILITNTVDALTFVHACQHIKHCRENILCSI